MEDRPESDNNCACSVATFQNEQPKTNILFFFKMSWLPTRKPNISSEVLGMQLLWWEPASIFLDTFLPFIQQAVADNALKGLLS